MLIDRAPLTKTINFNSNDERRSIDKAKGLFINAVKFWGKVPVFINLMLTLR